MRDDYTPDRTGWARFSDDGTMRYRLGRVPSFRLDAARPRKALWIMLNPSTADAFKPDPTVTECLKRSRSYGCEAVEVVNLFAFRSTYPADLYKRAFGFRGDSATNDAEILDACRGAEIVLAAWGNHGGLDGRDRHVMRLLAEAKVETWHLGKTKFGHPKHPLARGKHRIPADQAPEIYLHEGL